MNFFNASNPTLFDVHSAVGKHRQRLGDIADPVSILWRTKQLDYTWLRSLMGHHADFWQDTQDALDFAFDKHHVNDTDLPRDLMEAYLKLDCYPEVLGARTHLKNSGFKVAWVNRFGQPEGRLPGRPDVEIQSLIESPDLLE